MLYVTENHGFRGLLIYGYLTVIIPVLCVQLEAPTSCPDLCRCVEVENGGPATIVNYVGCRGVIKDLNEMSLPKNIVFLDLAGTSLRTIPAYHFMDRGLVEIVELDLSSNNLTHIYADIFVGLNNLKILNLSYNPIQYFDPHSLIYNDILTHLVLKGTHLPASDGSLVISRSLELLDVSECGIRTLPDLALSEIPYLKILNVSENPLSAIDPRVFDNLKWLKQLDITRTNIRCDHNLAALSDWGKAFSVAIAGYPCLNSHSLQGHSYRNYRRRTTVSEDGPEWQTPVPVGEDLQDNESKERLETDYGVRGGVVDAAEAADVEDDESPEDASEDIPDVSSPYPDIPDISSPYPDITGAAGVPVSDSKDANWPEFLSQVHWTIWLACVGGFALGVALTIGLGFTVYVCCCKQPDDPNELVSAGEDFQLVSSPVDEGPIIPDEPPSYSSLFSSRYHKVLPTAAVVPTNRGRS